MGQFNKWVGRFKRLEHIKITSSAIFYRYKLNIGTSTKAEIENTISINSYKNLYIDYFLNTCTKNC